MGDRDCSQTNRRIVIKVRGRVQGVFFRAHTKQFAESLGLTGWVQNEDDGGVMIIAEGPEEKLRELFLWCKKGPPGAKVESIEEYLDNATGEYQGFVIRYGEGS